MHLASADAPTSDGESAADASADSESDGEGEGKPNADGSGPTRNVYWAPPTVPSPAWLCDHSGVVVRVRTPAHVKRVVWHHKGDYVATVAPEVQ